MSLPPGKALVAFVGMGALTAFGTVYALVIEPREQEQLAADTLLEWESRSSVGLDPLGDWRVAEGSEVGYRVQHQTPSMASPREAVGKTQAIAGEMTVERSGAAFVITDITVEVDMTKLADDTATQGLAMYAQSLEPQRFPRATFVGRTPIRVPDPTGADATASFYLEGALTVHGVTRQVSIPVQARLEGEHLQAEGSLLFPIEDFGINPPANSAVTVEPNGTLEFRLLWRKAG